MLFTPPLSQTVTLSQSPSPLERDVLYGRPLRPTLLKLTNFYFFLLPKNFQLFSIDFGTLNSWCDQNSRIS